MIKGVFHEGKGSNASITNFAQYFRNIYKNGFISYNKLPNGYYDYSNDDVYKFLNKNIKREICIYTRVSTNKQKNDLENQLELLKQYCFTNGLQISSSYADIASGVTAHTP